MLHIKGILKSRLARSKGFTLVELLIVIMIIAILAGMLLLATGSSTDTAEAARLISDLRNLKSATMMYVIENGIDPGNLDGNVVIFDKDRNVVGSYYEDIFQYLDRSPLQFDENGNPGDAAMLPMIPTRLSVTIDGSTTERTFIGYDFSRSNWGGGGGLRDGLKKKLEDQAEKAGIFALVSYNEAAYYTKDSPNSDIVLMAFD